VPSHRHGAFNVLRLVIEQENLVRGQSYFCCHRRIELLIWFSTSQSAREERPFKSLSDAEPSFEILGAKLFLRGSEETPQPFGVKPIREL